MTPRIDAVVFDLDNTLVESKVDFTRMRSRIEDFLRENHPDIGTMEARTTMELLEILTVRGSDSLDEDIKDIHSIMDETEIESSENATPLIDLVEMLGRLGEMGLKLGLLTRSCREYSSRVLGESMGLFDSISCRSPKGYSKPDPRALEEIAAQLGVATGNTLLVGDHAIDGLCAQSAGAPFLAVTTGTSSIKDLSIYSPISVLDDLTSLPELIEVTNRKTRNPQHIY